MNSPAHAVLSADRSSPEQTCRPLRAQPTQQACVPCGPVVISTITYSQICTALRALSVMRERGGAQCGQCARVQSSRSRRRRWGASHQPRAAWPVTPLHLSLCRTTRAPRRPPAPASRPTNCPAWRTSSTPLQASLHSSPPHPHPPRPPYCPLRPTTATNFKFTLGREEPLVSGLLRSR